MTRWELERLAVIRILYDQQRTMYETNTHRIDDRIEQGPSQHGPGVAHSLGYRYTAEEKQKALDMTVEIGVNATCAALGISDGTIRRWLSDANQKPKQIRGYDEETKARALEMLKHEQINTVAATMGIARGTLAKWKKAAGIPAWGSGIRYDKETKQRAMELLPSLGLLETAMQTGISVGWLTELRKQAGIPTSKPYYSDAIKQQAFDMMEEVGVKKTAMEMGIARSTLGNWKRAAGIPPKGKGVITPAIKHCHRGHWYHQVLDKVRESGDQSMTGRASGFVTVMS